MFSTASIHKFIAPAIAASLATVVVVLHPTLARGEAARSSSANDAKIGNWVSAPRVRQNNQDRALANVGRIKIIERAEDQQSCRNTLFVPAHPRKCHGDFFSPEIVPGENANQASTSSVQEPPLRNPKIEVVETQPPTDEKVPPLKSTGSLNVEDKEKPKVSVNPKPAQPQAVEKDQPQSPTILSCDKAATIVAGYGFNRITPSDCDGQIYSFNASRDGKPFMIALNSVSGELIKVRKAP